MLTHPQRSIQCFIQNWISTDCQTQQWECCTSGKEKRISLTAHCIFQVKTALFKGILHTSKRNAANSKTYCTFEQHHLKHAALFAGILLDWCALREISLHDLHEKRVAMRWLHFLQCDLHLSNKYFTFRKDEASKYTPRVLLKCSVNDRALRECTFL